MKEEINKEGIELNKKFLESERLILKPLYFNELLDINNNKIVNLRKRKHIYFAKKLYKITACRELRQLQVVVSFV